MPQTAPTANSRFLSVKATSYTGVPLVMKLWLGAIEIALGNRCKSASISHVRTLSSDPALARTFPSPE